MAEIMTDQEKEVHLGFMREALAMVPISSFPFPACKTPSLTTPQATLALNTNETPVGCVFVYQGAIIGRGMNATNRTCNGTRHAEFIAVNDILTCPAEEDPSSEDPAERVKRKYSPDVLRECDLYVTVEPCIMCASLLRQLGVRRVFFGAGNEKFGGTGGVLDIHRSNGKIFDDGDVEGTKEKEREREEGDYEVSGGWLREEAIVLLRRFYVQENGRAPEPRKKERVLKLDVEPLDAGSHNES